MDDPAMHVSVGAILATYRASLDRARALLDALLAGPVPEEDPRIRSALQHAMLTPDDALGEAQREWLAVLRR
jgi:5'-methylthioadenosine phosphorylase